MAEHLHQHRHAHAHINHEHELMRRAAHAHPGPEPPTQALNPEPSKILARDDTSTPTGTCTDTTSPGCKLNSNTTTPTGAIIGISVAIPLVVALIVLVVLHRRATKKQAAEDARDAQADLDFGIDPKYKNTSKPNGRGKKGKGGAGVATADLSLEKELRKGGHGTGMSIDLGNPYILPPEMNGSRDSLHSLTRSLTDRQDPYRMVGQHSPSVHPYGDAGSIRSGSDRGLLTNPGPNPVSRSQSPLVQSGTQPTGIQRKQVPRTQQASDDAQVAMPTFDFTDHSATDARPHSTPSQKSVDVHSANRLSNQDKSLPATPQEDGMQSPPPRGASLGKHGSYGATNNGGPVDPYQFQEIVVPPSPDAESRQNAQNALSHLPEEPHDAASFPHPPPPEPTEQNRMTLGLGLDLPEGNRLSVLRPLPPDDPNDTAESRANRIRSFYKEYFADGDAHAYDASGFDYYEDYGDEYLQDGAVFDPETGQFIVAQAAYADPITRRAMTPPPRGPPPRFRGGPRRPGHASQGSAPGGPRGRAFSNASTSRMGGPRGRQPKRPLPPPSALKNLPTPHLLKDGDLNIAMDFAPPQRIRDVAAGRAESPLLGERPYSPAVPIANSPLASAFTELAVVPSPHSLRKSGTFTALDFVPPPKFRDPDGGGSDAGSIRSGRSNFSTVSARQQHNIRAGAYRLSRVPKDLVGSKNDWMDTLKPTWKMGA